MRFGAFALAIAATGAFAQSDWQRVAVPYYTNEHVARGEAMDLDARAQRFAEQSARLADALVAHCSGAPTDPRPAWRASVAAWDALAAIATGPLIERRSARRIDFMPVRPEQLARAVAAAPTGAEAMEHIGAPARGFAALEALLWPRVPTSATPACHYAVEVAAEVQREASAIASASAARLATRPQDDEAFARVAELLNQWSGGLEQLRWAWMRKPLEVARTRAAPAAGSTRHESGAEFPRAASRQTAAAWAERWRVLRSASVLGARPTPRPGEAPVPFETMLRGQGLNPLADRLVQATARADAAMRGLEPGGDEGRVRAAADALGALGSLVQDEVASALSVRIGFSDADGD